MFQTNYLGHDFVNQDSVNNLYICVKCKIEIYHSIVYNIIYDRYSQYYTFIDNKEAHELTCDEMIIKNIIE